MRKWSHLISTTGMIAALFLLPLKASAIDLQLQWVSGDTRLGMIGNEAWIAWKPHSNGSCIFWKVGDAQGLNQNVTIRAANAGGSNTMLAFHSDGWNFCGYTWRAINPHGYYIRFHGSYGNDVLNGRAYGMAGWD